MVLYALRETDICLRQFDLSLRFKKKAPNSQRLSALWSFVPLCKTPSCRDDYRQFDPDNERFGLYRKLIKQYLPKTPFAKTDP